MSRAGEKFLHTGDGRHHHPFGRDAAGGLRADGGERLAAERNLIFVHPYDDPLVIAGQGTIALEMLEEVPDLDVLITQDAPSPLNPLGLKGAGEGGINPVGAAIAAAIDDAIGIPGAITRLPVTPQRLRDILKRAGR